MFLPRDHGTIVSFDSTYAEDAKIHRDVNFGARRIVIEQVETIEFHASGRFRKGGIRLDYAYDCGQPSSRRSVSRSESPSHGFLRLPGRTIQFRGRISAIEREVSPTAASIRAFKD